MWIRLVVCAAPSFSEAFANQSVGLSVPFLHEAGSEGTGRQQRAIMDDIFPVMPGGSKPHGGFQGRSRVCTPFHSSPITYFVPPGTSAEKSLPTTSMNGRATLFWDKA